MIKNLRLHRCISDLKLACYPRNNGLYRFTKYTYNVDKEYRRTGTIKPARPNYSEE